MISPTNLVHAASLTSRRATWFDKLSPVQQVYVENVIAAMLHTPDATARGVSIALKKELNINAGLTTISETLRKMCNEKEKS
jgi:hypothetical protein